MKSERENFIRARSLTSESAEIEGFILLRDSEPSFYLVVRWSDELTVGKHALLNDTIPTLLACVLLANVYFSPTRELRLSRSCAK